ncbi:MAG: hypothetical protein IPJ61_16615 [Tessaracoccus sp.]|uniref:hypothetical protein n=1 Tax=Tessaracoccus sp. TaxID=1971211 RepID=UPI001EB1337C|nr:hypothetical protein [Tessaracoccus sp.]MBK7822634.1 hypothetical protein [Tessaracoccus sp.]
MLKFGRPRLVRLAVVVIAVLFFAPQADAAYSWGTSSVSKNGKVMGYGYGTVTGQFLQITSTAYTRYTSSLDGRGVYSSVYSYQVGYNAQARSFRHPNAPSSSYTKSTMKQLYSVPTHLPWKAKARVCVDIAWAPDHCGSWTSPGDVY